MSVSEFCALADEHTAGWKEIKDRVVKRLQKVQADSEGIMVRTDGYSTTAATRVHNMLRGAGYHTIPVKDGGFVVGVVVRLRE